MNEFIRRPSKRRDNKVFVPPTHAVKQSIRHSWTSAQSQHQGPAAAGSAPLGVEDEAIRPDRSGTAVHLVARRNTNDRHSLVRSPLTLPSAGMSKMDQMMESGSCSRVSLSAPPSPKDQPVSPRSPGQMSHCSESIEPAELSGRSIGSSGAHSDSSSLQSAPSVSPRSSTPARRIPSPLPRVDTGQHSIITPGYSPNPTPIPSPRQRSPLLKQHAFSEPERNLSHESQDSGFMLTPLPTPLPRELHKFSDVSDSGYDYQGSPKTSRSSQHSRQSSGISSRTDSREPTGESLSVSDFSDTDEIEPSTGVVFRKITRRKRKDGTSRERHASDGTMSTHPQMIRLPPWGQNGGANSLPHIKPCSSHSAHTSSLQFTGHGSGEFGGEGSLTRSNLPIGLGTVYSTIPRMCHSDGLVHGTTGSGDQSDLIMGEKISAISKDVGVVYRSADGPRKTPTGSPVVKRIRRAERRWRLRSPDRSSVNMPEIFNSEAADFRYENIHGNDSNSGMEILRSEHKTENYLNSSMENIFLDTAEYEEDIPLVSRSFNSEVNSDMLISITDKIFPESDDYKLVFISSSSSKSSGLNSLDESSEDASKPSSRRVSSVLDDGEVMVFIDEPEWEIGDGVPTNKDLLLEHDSDILDSALKWPKKNSTSQSLFLSNEIQSISTYHDIVESFSPSHSVDELETADHVFKNQQRSEVSFNESSQQRSQSYSFPQSVCFPSKHSNSLKCDATEIVVTFTSDTDFNQRNTAICKPYTTFGMLENFSSSMNNPNIYQPTDFCSFNNYVKYKSIYDRFFSGNYLDSRTTSNVTNTATYSQTCSNNFQCSDSNRSSSERSIDEMSFFDHVKYCPESKTSNSDMNLLSDSQNYRSQSFEDSHLLHESPNKSILSIQQDTHIGLSSWTNKPLSELASTWSFISQDNPNKHKTITNDSTSNHVEYSKRNISTKLGRLTSFYDPWVVSASTQEDFSLQTLLSIRNADESKPTRDSCNTIETEPAIRDRLDLSNVEPLFRSFEHLYEVPLRFDEWISEPILLGSVTMAWKENADAEAQPDYTTFDDGCSTILEQKQIPIIVSSSKPEQVESATDYWFYKIHTEETMELMMDFEAESHIDNSMDVQSVHLNIDEDSPSIDASSTSTFLEEPITDAGVTLNSTNISDQALIDNLSSESNLQNAAEVKPENSNDCRKEVSVTQIDIFLCDDSSDMASQSADQIDSFSCDLSNDNSVPTHFEQMSIFLSDELNDSFNSKLIPYNESQPQQILNNELDLNYQGSYSELNKVDANKKIAEKGGDQDYDFPKLQATCSLNVIDLKKPDEPEPNTNRSEICFTKLMQNETTILASASNLPANRLRLHDEATLPSIQEENGTVLDVDCMQKQYRLGSETEHDFLDEGIDISESNSLDDWSIMGQQSSISAAQAAQCFGTSGIYFDKTLSSYFNSSSNIPNAVFKANSILFPVGYLEDLDAPNLKLKSSNELQNSGKLVFYLAPQGTQSAYLVKSESSKISDDSGSSKLFIDGSNNRNPTGLANDLVSKIEQQVDLSSQQTDENTFSEIGTIHAYNPKIHIPENEIFDMEICENKRSDVDIAVESSPVDTEIVWSSIDQVDSDTDSQDTVIEGESYHLIRSLSNYKKIIGSNLEFNKHTTSSNCNTKTTMCDELVSNCETAETTNIHTIKAVPNLLHFTPESLLNIGNTELQLMLADLNGESAKLEDMSEISNDSLCDTVNTEIIKALEVTSSQVCDNDFEHVYSKDNFSHCGTDETNKTGTKIIDITETNIVASIDEMPCTSKAIADDRTSLPVIDSDRKYATCEMVSHIYSGCSIQKPQRSPATVLVTSTKVEANSDRQDFKDDSNPVTASFETDYNNAEELRSFMEMLLSTKIKLNDHDAIFDHNLEKRETSHACSRYDPALVNAEPDSNYEVKLFFETLCNTKIKLLENEEPETTIVTKICIEKETSMSNTPEARSDGTLDSITQASDPIIKLCTNAQSKINPININKELPSSMASILEQQALQSNELLDGETSDNMYHAQGTILSSESVLNVDLPKMNDKQVYIKQEKENETSGSKSSMPTIDISNLQELIAQSKILSNYANIHEKNANEGDSSKSDLEKYYIESLAGAAAPKYLPTRKLQGIADNGAVLRTELEKNDSYVDERFANPRINSWSEVLSENNDADNSERQDESMDDSDSTFSDSASSEEANFDHEEELRGFSRTIDLSLHTIIEESCEESESERDRRRDDKTPQPPPDPSDLEKYFNFTIGDTLLTLKKRHSGGTEDSEFSDTISETSSSIYSEGIDNADDDIDPAVLASSRLEKYFMTGFLGIERYSPFNNPEDTDESGNPDSASECSSLTASLQGSPHSSRRSSSLFSDSSSNKITTGLSLHVMADTETKVQSPIPIPGEDNQMSSTEDDGNEIPFGKNDGFDTIKRKKKNINDAQMKESTDGSQKSSKHLPTQSEANLAEGNSNLTIANIKQVKNNDITENNKMQGDLSKSKDEKGDRFEHEKPLGIFKLHIKSDLSHVISETTSEAALDGRSEKEMLDKIEHIFSQIDTLDDKYLTDSATVFDVNKKEEISTITNYESNTFGRLEMKFSKDTTLCFNDIVTVDSAMMLGEGIEGLSELEKPKVFGLDRKQQSRDSGFIGSSDDLLKDTTEVTDHPVVKDKIGDDKSSSTVLDNVKIMESDLKVDPLSKNIDKLDENILAKRRVVREWSTSDDETRYIVGQLMDQITRSLSWRINSSPPLPRAKPPELEAFESELTTLMKTVPGIDATVKEIVEELSSTDYYSDSYESSEYNSSEPEGPLRLGFLRRSIRSSLRSNDDSKLFWQKDNTGAMAATSHDVVSTDLQTAGVIEDVLREDANSPFTRETVYIYEKLMASLGHLAEQASKESSDNELPGNHSPSSNRSQRSATVRAVQHIRDRLTSLMLEVQASSEGSTSGRVRRNNSSSSSSSWLGTQPIRDSSFRLHASGDLESTKPSYTGSLHADIARWLAKQPFNTEDEQSVSSTSSTTYESEDSPTDTEMSVESDDANTPALNINKDAKFSRAVISIAKLERAGSDITIVDDDLSFCSLDTPETLFATHKIGEEVNPLMLESKKKRFSESKLQHIKSLQDRGVMDLQYYVTQGANNEFEVWQSLVIDEEKFKGDGIMSVTGGHTTSSGGRPTPRVRHLLDSLKSSSSDTLQCISEEDLDSKPSSSRTSVLGSNTNIWSSQSSLADGKRSSMETLGSSLDVTTSPPPVVNDDCDSLRVELRNINIPLREVGTTRKVPGLMTLNIPFSEAETEESIAEREKQQYRSSFHTQILESGEINLDKDNIDFRSSLHMWVDNNAIPKPAIRAVSADPLPQDYVWFSQTQDEILCTPTNMIQDVDNRLLETNLSNRSAAASITLSDNQLHKQSNVIKKYATFGKIGTHARTPQAQELDLSSRHRASTLPRIGTELHANESFLHNAQSSFMTNTPPPTAVPQLKQRWSHLQRIEAPARREVRSWPGRLAHRFCSTEGLAAPYHEDSTLSVDLHQTKLIAGKKPTRAPSNVSTSSDGSKTLPVTCIPQISVSGTQEIHTNPSGRSNQISHGNNSDRDSVPEEDIDRLVALHKTRSSLSSLGTRSDSMTSVYSAAGGGRYGTVVVRGEVLFGLSYNYKAGALEVNIKQCRELASVDTKRMRSDPYVKVYLLPDKSKSGKRKTKVRKHTLNPSFEEVLRFNVTISELETRTLWLTVWHSDMFGRNDFLGEVMLPLGYEVFDDPAPKWYPLQERLGPPEEVMTYKGELILALKLVPPDVTTQKKGKQARGSLHVLVKEARNLTAVRANGTSDPFCKSYLLPDKGKTSKQKTHVIKKNCNPKWNHTFVYEDVSLDDLRERCLELTVWDYDRLTSNDFLGGIRLSLGTGRYQGKEVDWMDSRGDEIAIWQTMIDRPNTWIDGMLLLASTMENRPL